MSMRVGGGSRPSKNNCQGHAQGAKNADLDSFDGSTCGTGTATGEQSEPEPDRPDELDPSDLLGDAGLRPISVEPGRRLRDEAVMEQSEGPQSRPFYAVVNEWRKWMHDYESMHIEYEQDGETVRTQLENSYQRGYGKRYYARLKDLERGIERKYESLTTVMLTFSASSRNAEGHARCPADHMRDIAKGWDTARKQLHQVLNGVNWEYAKVWEPHESGYGHMHVAVFIDGNHLTESLGPDRFQPVIDSYLRACKPAGREAHTLEKAVSVNGEIENLGSYISEYIGIFGERALDRELKEQMFYATTWATGTRRVEFSNGAQEIINTQQWVRETGLRPQDRGEAGTSTSATQAGESGTEGDESDDWNVESICTVRKRSPDYADPTSGGIEMTAIAGRPGMDPPPELD